MGHTREVWCGDEGDVLLEFDFLGRIDNKTWIDSPDSLRGKLRRWIPWI